MLETLAAYCALFLISLIPWPSLQKRMFLLGGILSAALFGFLVYQPVAASLPTSMEILPQLGVWLSMSPDGLSWSFGCLVLFIAACVFFYAHGYVEGAAQARFSSSLILFTLAMLGLVFSDNLFSFFIFWELTTLSSYLLISLKDKEPEYKEAARIVFFVTLAGGFFLFVGLLWMQQIGLQQGLSLYEASHFSSLMSLAWAEVPAAPIIFILLLLGAGSKSAQFPFHFWLPQAMAAPTPVSSFLHSATMVKAGIFLLAKIFPGFHEIGLWSPTLISLGLVTALVAAFLCASEKDLKKILAWTTVSVLGTLVMLLGIATEMAIKAFVVFIFAHALYKASLFQVAGNIDKSTGTRDLDLIHSLLSPLLLTALAGFLAALSSAGLPPFFGFIGKELVLKSLVDFSSFEALLLLSVVLINAFLFSMLLLVGFKCFLKTRDSKLKSLSAKKLSLWMSLPPLLLALMGLFFGLFPDTFSSLLGNPMSTFLLGGESKLSLKLWHGLDTALVLSLVSFALGGFAIATYARWKGRFRSRLQKLPELKLWTAAFLDQLIKTFWNLNELQIRRSLSTYMVISGSFVIGIFILVFQSTSSFSGLNFSWRQIDWSSQTESFLFIILAATCIAAFSMLFIYRFIVAAIVLGLVGAALAVLFAWFGAADLAFTQILAELLIAVLVATFGFKVGNLPSFRQDSMWAPRVVLAIAFGTCLFLLALIEAPSDVQYLPRDFYVSKSYVEAFGENIVNVILVDFRSLDTLNEVLVVLVAAIGVTVLLRKKSLEELSQKESDS